MCSRIQYRKSGGIYECILVSDSGDVDVVGRGTMEDIVRFLSDNDLNGVSPSLIEQDILKLCEQ